MSKTEAVSTSSAPAPIGPYSQAVKANGFLFLSGQIPLDPSSGEVVQGPIEAQTERVMENLKAVLGQAGLAPSDVVKTSIYLADMADFPRVNEVYGRYFGESKPARSTFQVAGLPKGVGVEIDAIAVL